MQASKADKTLRVDRGCSLQGSAERKRLSSHFPHPAKLAFTTEAAELIATDKIDLLGRKGISKLQLLGGFEAAGQIGSGGVGMTIAGSEIQEKICPPPALKAAPSHK